MEQFIARYRPFVTAVLSGFDRLVFRGTMLPLVIQGGMFTFLTRAGVQLLDFKKYVVSVSERVKEASLRTALEQGRPVRYLESAALDKEALARQLLAEYPVEQGLICVFKTVEPCMSFEYHRSAERRERGLRLRPSKCLHLYHYALHPLFGFFGARLQTWFPFNIQIWVNGREWLARQLQKTGHSDFRRHDNCFTALGNPALAQRLMDRQLKIGWKRVLDAIARTLNPLQGCIFKPWPQSYYWSAYQSEWATDLVFRNPQSLAAVYPALVQHATTHFKSPDVLRFLGRKAHGNFTGELTGSFRQRPEGIRVKHWINGNSIKMYDKAGSVLRIETTLAKTADFKVFRPLQDQPQRTLAWRPLRKGIADLHRRAQLSQRANDSYLQALATVEDTTPLHQVFDQVAQPVTYHDRRVRALRIGDPNDIALLQAVSRGEFATAGFRNRDLRRLLHSTHFDASTGDIRKLSARISRQLRILRAHGLIRKLPKSHRYRLTSKGHQLTAALSAIRQTSLKHLIGTHPTPA